MENKKVILVGCRTPECDQTIHMLTQHGYPCQPIENLKKLTDCLKKAKPYCIIFDLDTICIDNRTIRNLTIEHPSVYFLCMSKDRFHPELKDAICCHIYACLTKPLDYDELLYWLRCIDAEQDTDPSDKNMER